MAQPSVASYFNNRKRSAAVEDKISSNRKVFILDSSSSTKSNILDSDSEVNQIVNKSSKKEWLLLNKVVEEAQIKKKNAMKPKRKSKIVMKEDKNQQNLLELFTSINKHPVILEDGKNQTQGLEIQTTPPSTPTKTTFNNAMDKVKDNMTLKHIKSKISRSSRLAELRASINRFNESSKKLKKVEEQTCKIVSKSLKLKDFKSIELEVAISPQKVKTPEKQYLSPKKDHTARKNLLSLLSPTKNAVALLQSSPSKKILDFTSKPALTLPFKYRYLAEMFRSIDTVCQIMYNRKETITLSKIKPAVEQMLKRNFSEQYLAQIKNIFPESFDFRQEKLRVFGTGKREEKWELVITPLIGEADHITAEILLSRRRTLFNILLDKVKDYHNEFLLSLEKPLNIPKDKITRWHPEFDIEKLPDIDKAELPQQPEHQKLTTGKEVLDKARDIFNCNTRMEMALERLKEAKKTETKMVEPKVTKEPTSVLKGIPKALLEKVRERQAANALMSMTRTADKDKELQKYSRLPELVRLTRNLFVAEKKSVLPIEIVVKKLANSYREFLTETALEEHIKLIAKEVPEWMILPNMRNTLFVKIMKNSDLSVIIAKLEKLTKQKSET